MFHIQQGFWPRLIWIVGFGVIGYAFFSCLYLLQSTLLEIAAADIRISSSLVLRLLFGTMPFVGAVAIGIGLSGLYPEVRATRLGLRYRYLLFLGGTVPWREIEGVVPIRLLRGTSAILIAPLGSTVARLARYAPNYFYGFLAGFEQPIILLAPGLHEREQLIQEVIRNQQANTGPQG